MAVGPSVIHQYVLELLKKRMIVEPVGDQGTVWLGVEGFDSIGILDEDAGAAVHQLYSALEQLVLDKLDRGDIGGLPPAGDTDFQDARHRAIVSYHQRPPVGCDPEQAWYWTAEWQAGEREADADLAAGRGMYSPDSESFLAGLP